LHYDLWPGNGAYATLTAPETTPGVEPGELEEKRTVKQQVAQLSLTNPRDALHTVVLDPSCYNITRAKVCLLSVTLRPCGKAGSVSQC